MHPRDARVTVYLASVGSAGWALHWDWALRLGALCVRGWGGGDAGGGDLSHLGALPQARVGSLGKGS